MTITRGAWCPGALFLVACTASVPPGQTGILSACGWWDQPTPGNVWFHNQRGEWMVARQGAWAATGPWPEFAAHQTLPPDAPGGVGCVCLVAQAASHMPDSIGSDGPVVIRIDKISAHNPEYCVGLGLAIPVDPELLPPENIP